MDTLLRALNSCTLSKSMNKNDFDDIIRSVESLHTDDADEEWDTLSANYSKLLYLSHLIEFYEFPETEKFKEILIHIINEIDKKNQYYLSELSWDDHAIQEELDFVKEFFEKSLNEQNIFTRIKYILEGYSVLIQVIEDFRNEKFVNYIEDPVFIQSVETIHKRRKIN